MYLTFSSAHRMPYVEAVILEMLRFASIVPTGLLHTALEDVMIGEYKIPKGTWVTPNLVGIHHDKKIWGDPENFRPERFLNENNEVIKHEALLPFSYGKRLCIGEGLARDELFMFVCGIFQAFTVGPDPNSPELTTEQLLTNIISVPKPHMLIVKERKA